MDYGSLNIYFSGFGAKRLSAVEVSPDSSNQHELNGIAEFKQIFGIERTVFRARFLYLTDDEESCVEATGSLTWYDARENDPSRSEYRLYYSSDVVIGAASPGDSIFVCKISSSELFVVVAPNGSTSEKQILWLLGVQQVGNKFLVKDLATEKVALGFAGKYILETLGIELKENEPSYLEELIQTFGLQFPKTNEFSAFARSKASRVSSVENPDEILILWMSMEERLFKTLEREIVQRKLSEGFGDNVDDFISFSLSVQNRRKSRAGHAFENHLAVLFDQNNVKYAKGQQTERNNKPDFIFPGINNYADSNFSSNHLTMLAVKTSAKDRWRQVLSEADRIAIKHLITLQPSISKNQTDEMREQGVQLVIPQPIIISYTEEQKRSLVTLADFIKIVLDKQKLASA
jgi:hypothetical protein